MDLEPVRQAGQAREAGLGRTEEAELAAGLEARQLAGWERTDNPL